MRFASADNLYTNKDVQSPLPILYQRRYDIRVPLIARDLCAFVVDNYMCLR